MRKMVWGLYMSTLVLSGCSESEKPDDIDRMVKIKEEEEAKEWMAPADKDIAGDPSVQETFIREEPFLSPNNESPK